MSEPMKPTHLRVESGNPSPEDLAIVISVIQAALSQATELRVAEDRVAHWHRNAGILRGQILPGHGQWVASLRRGLY